MRLDLFAGVPLHLSLFPKLWLDVHASSHIDRKHINALLCSSYTVDYMDAVLLDERSSLSVPSIHAFLKTFFPKLAHHVLTEQTCSLIDNTVTSLVNMVDVVDVSLLAYRLTGDLRALALVYNSGTQIKPTPSLQLALDTLLTRTKSLRAKETKDSEAPSKKRKFSAIDEKEKKDDVANSGDESAAESCSKETTKDDEEDAKPSESLELDFAEKRLRPKAAGSAANSRAPTNVSWLEMLEKTIVNLQVIVQMQLNN